MEVSVFLPARVGERGCGGGREAESNLQILIFYVNAQSAAPGLRGN